MRVRIYCHLIIPAPGGTFDGAGRKFPKAGLSPAPTAPKRTVCRRIACVLCEGKDDHAAARRQPPWRASRRNARDGARREVPTIPNERPPVDELLCRRELAHGAWFRLAHRKLGWRRTLTRLRRRTFASSPAPSRSLLPSRSQIPVKDTRKRKVQDGSAVASPATPTSIEVRTARPATSFGPARGPAPLPKADRTRSDITCRCRRASSTRRDSGSWTRTRTGTTPSGAPSDRAVRPFRRGSPTHARIPSFFLPPPASCACPRNRAQSRQPPRTRHDAPIPPVTLACLGLGAQVWGCGGEGRDHTGLPPSHRALRRTQSLVEDASHDGRIACVCLSRKERERKHRNTWW